MVRTTPCKTRKMGEGVGAPRDRYVDFLRAFSILVVVVWHWVFTVVWWADDGPHASNPIGSTYGLWFLTWFLQVLPLFFFVGGYATLKAWERSRGRGEAASRFVWTRWMQLLIPASVLLGFAFVAGTVVGWIDPDPGWLDQALLLIISPLWFLVIYLVVTLISPLAIWAHGRWGELVLVFMVAATSLVDVGRFAEDADGMALVNLIVVWALCFQFGFSYERLASAPRRTLWVITWAGFFSLVALVRTGLYPLSMVGVPGDKFSNMAPPTLCIVALLFFQTGVAMLLRPGVLERLDRPRWASFSRLANRYAMGIFLWHTTGFAVAYALLTALGLQPPQEATLGWWATRPIWLLLPALFTVPLVLGFDRLMAPRVRRVPDGTPGIDDLAASRSDSLP